MAISADAFLDGADEAPSSFVGQGRSADAFLDEPDPPRARMSADAFLDEGEPTALERVGQNVAEFGKGVPEGVLSVGGTALKGAAGLAAAPEETRFDRERAIRGLETEAVAARSNPEAQAALRRRVDETFANDQTGRQMAHAALSDILEGTTEPRPAPPEPTPVQERPLYQAGEAVERLGRELLPAAPGYEQSVGRQLGTGVGSVAGGVALSLLSPYVAGGTFALSGAGEAVDRAVKEGATREQIIAAAKGGLIPGLSDSVPVEVLLDRLQVPLPAVGPVLRFIGRVGLQAAIEAIQEGGQEFLQNLVAREVYKPDQDLIEGVVPSAALGGGVGVIVETGAGLVRRRGGGAPQIAEQPQVAPVAQDTPQPAQPSAVVPTPQPPSTPQSAQPPGPSVADLRSILDDDRPVAEIMAEREQQARAEQAHVTREQLVEQVQQETGDIAIAEAFRKALDGKGARTAPMPAETSADVDAAAAQVNPEPTPAQAEAGNYRKGHVKVQGLDIAIETARGDTRTGIGRDGRPWSSVAPAHYGYIKRTTGKDGDQVDVYIGDNPHSDLVVIVDQIDPETGRFDEHKIVLAADSRSEAVAIYDAGFSDDSGPRRRGAVSTMTMPEFKAWLANGDTKKPLAYRAPSPPAAPATPPAVERAAPPSAPDPLPVEPGAVAPSFVPEQYLEPAARALRERTLAPTPRAVANRFRLTPQQASLVLDLVAARDGAVRKTAAGTYRLAPQRRAPMDLVTFIASRGGIRDDGGELRAMDAHRRFVPGFGPLVRPNGVTPDYVREAAVEAGYLPDGATVDDLLQAIDASLRGQSVFSTGDATQTVEREAARAIERQTDRYGDEATALSRARDEVNAIARELGLELTQDEVNGAVDLVARQGWETADAIHDVAERGAQEWVERTFAAKPETDENARDEKALDDTGTGGASGAARQAPGARSEPVHRPEARGPAAGEQPREDRPRADDREAPEQGIGGAAKGPLRNATAERLRATARRMAERAEESLGRDRLANTARRARMAASAEAGARAELAMAKTLERVADAIESGDAPRLALIRSRAEIETLDRLLRSAVYQAEQGKQRPEFNRAPTAEDVARVRYPYPEILGEVLDRFLKDLPDVKGHIQDKRAAARLIDNVGRQARVRFDDLRRLEILASLVQAAKKARLSRWQVDRVADVLAEFERVRRMGLRNEAELREALTQYLGLRAKKQGEDRIKRMERELIGAKIPGYFPTPRPLVDRMLEHADIQATDDVLEPEAGKGSIADGISEIPHKSLTTIEVAPRLVEILKAKGYEPITDSFLEHQGNYDKIVMNPPFEDGQDIGHVQHAYSLLKPGGRVVAIMSEGPFFRQDKKATAFREWLDQVGGTSERNPEGAFETSERPTGVATRIVIIDKPKARASAFQVAHQNRPGLTGKPPVAVVNVQPMFRGMLFRQMRNAYQAWAAKNIRGLYRNADTGWDILVSRGGIKEATSGTRIERDFAILTRVPELLQSAVLVETAAPKSPEEGVRAYHYLYGAAAYEGQVYRVRLTVVEQTNGRRFYDQHSTRIESPGVNSAALKGEPLKQPHRPPGPLTPGVVSAAQGDVSATSALRPATGATINLGDLLAGVNYSDGTPVAVGGNRGPSAFQREAVQRIGPDVIGVDRTAPEWSARREEVKRRLHAIVRERAPRLRLEVFDELVAEIDGRREGVFGAYTQRRRGGVIEHIAAVSLRSPEPAGTLSHEIIHFLRQAGYLNEQEWSVLSRLAPQWRKRFDIDEAYRGAPEDVLVEEAIAQAYHAWETGELRPDPRAVRVFAKIRAFFERVANMLRGLGFQTWQDVFERIDRGDVGRRTLADASDASAPRFQFRTRKEAEAEAEQRTARTGRRHFPYRWTLAGQETGKPWTVLTRGETLDDAVTAGILAPEDRDRYLLLKQGLEARTRAVRERTPEPVQMVLLQRATATLKQPPAPALPFDQDLTGFQKWLIHPRTIAAYFPQFASVWNAGVRQFARRDQIAAELITLKKPYDDLTREEKAKVDKVLELGRLQAETYQADRDGRITVTNKAGHVVSGQIGGASLSKSGERITLEPKEAQAYLAIRKTMDRALDLFRDQVLREWDFDPSLPDTPKTARAVEELAKQAEAKDDIAEAERLGKLAQILADIEMARKRGYVPFSRFGQWYVTIRSSDGDVIHREHFEAPIAAQQIPVLSSRARRELARRIEARRQELRKIYPPSQGFTVDRAERVTPKTLQDLPSLADIDGLLAAAHLDVTTARKVEEAIDRVLKERGFRKHFIQSRNIPGYSLDFERSLADYVTGLAGYIARREARPLFDDAIAAIPDTMPKLRQYAQQWDEYIQNPSEEWGRIRQAGFLFYLAGRASSAMVNLSQVPVVTMPYLSQFADPGRVNWHLSRAYRDVAGMFWVKKGLTLFDPDKAPADVRDDLKRAFEDGTLVPLETFQEMAKAHGRTPFGRDLDRKARTAMDLAALAFSGAERINRIVTFIAANRIARMPGAMDRANRILRDNALWSSTDEWRSPYGFGKWAVDETHYVMGKLNRPTFMRWVGSAIFQFRGFTANTLELFWRMGFQHEGPQGKAALAITAMMLFAMAGLFGLPGADDLKDLLETIYKGVAGYDVDLEREWRELWGGGTAGRVMARGAAREVTGVDLSRRVGMGDILPGGGSLADEPWRQIAPYLGVWYDLLILRPLDVATATARGDALGAAQRAVPEAIADPLKAAQWAERGVIARSSGRKIIDSEQTLPTGEKLKAPSNLAKRALGFQPTGVARAMEEYQAINRASRAATDLAQTFNTRLAMAMIQEERATTEQARAAARADQEKILAEIEAHNAKAPEHLQIVPFQKGKPSSGLRSALERERMGAYTTQEKRAPKKARSEVETIRPLY